MTDGTSQGLFVVVAIVIFGIFVALSYTVFGNDGLSGGITNLFENAVEDTNGRITGLSEIKEFSMSDVEPFFGTYTEFLNSENQIIFGPDTSTNFFLGGLMFTDDHFEYGKTYTISFDMTKLSGDIPGIGGHLRVTNNADVYINGERTTEMWRDGYRDDRNDWHNGVVYPNDLETHRITVVFTVDTDDTGNQNVYIQPNRNTGGGTYGIHYEVMIENLVLYEHTN